uniref:Uncharacterized protein n=2 Tax=Rhodnius prolixus TaxID=13249 RepID=A0A4P6D9R4_RHOPR
MGSVILNTVGLTLMVITMITNFFVPNYTKEYTSLIQHSVMYSTTVTIFLGHFANFVAAFLDNVDLILCGRIILGIGFPMWLISSILGFYHSRLHPFYLYVCISGVRCPDVLWLFDARWRYLGYDCPVYDIYQTWPDYPRKQNLSIPVIEEYWNNLITINMNKSSTNASVLAIIDNTAKDGYMNIMHNITNINVTLLQEDIGASLFPGCDVGKIRFIIYSVVLLLLYLIFMILTFWVNISYRLELMEM